MMRPDAKVETVYPYPKPLDLRKAIDGPTVANASGCQPSCHVSKSKLSMNCPNTNDRCL